MAKVYKKQFKRFMFTNRTDYPTKFDLQLDTWIKKPVMEQEMMNSIDKDFK